jgi:hypothetical protein
MKNLSRALRMAALALLLFLALIGISIGGGVPVPFSKRKENTAEYKIELVEVKGDEIDKEQE